MTRGHGELSHLDSLKRAYLFIGRQEVSRAGLLGQGRKPRQQDVMTEVLLGKQSLVCVPGSSAQ